MPAAINPDRNVAWNALPMLPPPQEAFKDVDVYLHLGKAKQAMGLLLGRSTSIPNQGLLINTISLQEAKASSEIENIFTTDDELYKAYSESNTKQAVGAAKEVLNYREALWQGYQHLTDHRAMNVQLVIDTYRTVTGFNDGIRPPVAQTVIRQAGTEPHAGRVIYTPPRGAALLETLLENLTDFLNDDEQYPIDPLIKMCIGHYQFEAIHPFRDGNGRTGRIINILYLTSKGLLDYPILHLSRFILVNKSEYYEKLAGVTQRADWRGWIIFMLRAIENTATHTFGQINDIIDAQQAILNHVESLKLKRPSLLVNSIFTQPFTTVNHITGEHGYAENTARKYLDLLAQHSILEKRTVKGNVYYLNLELYRILAG